MNCKKSTTYTVLKKLCGKGIFQNENAIVSSLINRDEYYTKQSIHFVEDTFGGSLRKFLTSFIGTKKLSKCDLFGRAGGVSFMQESTDGKHMIFRLSDMSYSAL